MIPNLAIINNQGTDFSGTGNISIRGASNGNADIVKHGERVSVLWPDQNIIYSDVVKTLDKDVDVTILYDDGNNYRLNLNTCVSI